MAVFGVWDFMKCSSVIWRFGWAEDLMWLCCSLCICVADTDSVASHRTGTSNLANSDSVSLKKIVDTFYDRVVQHDDLKPFFAHMSTSDMDKLRRHQVRGGDEVGEGDMAGGGPGWEGAGRQSREGLVQGGSEGGGAKAGRGVVLDGREQEGKAGRGWSRVGVKGGGPKQEGGWSWMGGSRKAKQGGVGPGWE